MKTAALLGERRKGKSKGEEAETKNQKIEGEKEEKIEGFCNGGMMAMSRREPPECNGQRP